MARFLQYRNLSTDDPVPGAHVSEVEFQEADEAVSGPSWSGIIAVEGQLTGDGRMIEEGALRWETPLPLTWMREQGEFGHDGAVLVGRIDTIERRGGELHAAGVVSNSSREAREFIDRVTDPDLPPIGVSIDVDDVSLEIRVASEVLEQEAELHQLHEEGEIPEGETDEDGRITVMSIDADDEVMVTTDARIRAAAGTDHAAFAETHLQMDEALVAAVTGDRDLPVAALDREWDGQGAQSRMLDDCTNDDDETDPACLRRGYLWQESDTDGTAQAHYKLPYADVIDGSLRIVPQGVYAVASVLGGGRGGVEGISEEDQDRLRSATCSLYDRIREVHGDEDVPDCPFDSQTASLVASISAPPREWFEDPELDDLTPLTITDEGRVFGHLAPWDACHVGYSGCVKPPSSSTDYAYFHVGETRTTDGSVATGVIAMDTVHAPDRGLSPQETLAHYEHTGLAVADVRAGEDEHGIWVAGAMRSDISEQTVDRLRRHPPSGDWRRIGGNLELVAALAVNTPGYPVPRTKALVASGQVQMLQTGGVTGKQDLTDEEWSVLRQIAQREITRASRDRREDVEQHKRRVLAASALSRITAYGCNCGKKKSQTKQRQWVLITESGKEKPYSTRLEAKAALRRHGGGTVTRR